jgi:hypothetical protein
MKEIRMIRKSLMTLLLGVTLAGAGATIYAQESPKPESPDQEAPSPKPESPDLIAQESPKPESPDQEAPKPESPDLIA